MLVTTITIDIFRLVLYSTFKPYIACDRPVDHVYNVGGKLFSEVLEGLGRVMIMICGLWIVHFVCRLVGYPGHYRRLFGLRQEEVS